ncbi:MAG: hypothetical protein WCL39_13870, partial [Armatimonadota bacterium]
DVLSETERKSVIERVLNSANTAGHIATIPGSEGCVGYDPGLVLMNLSPGKEADAAYERCMRMVDNAGAWNEYYGTDDHIRPGCCRCRPWETGLNAAAVVGYFNR